MKQVNMLSDFNRFLALSAFCLILMLLVAALHFIPNFDSMLRGDGGVINQAYLQIVVELHHDKLIAFARRPFTTQLVLLLNQGLGLDMGSSFVLVSFGCLFLAGVMLAKLSLRRNATYAQAALNVLAFYLCFANLFAFVPPVYTYDEPIFYVLIFTAFYLLDRANLWPFILMFSAALIAREAAIFLLPGVILLLKHKDGLAFSSKDTRLLLMLSVPVLVYLAYRMGFDALTTLKVSDGPIAALKFGRFNFQDGVHMKESVFSGFVVLALPLFLVIYHYRKCAGHGRDISAFLLVCLLNTTVVLCIASARESRVFALPLILLWPVFGQLFGAAIWRTLAAIDYKKLWARFGFWVVLGGLTVLNYQLSMVEYRTTVSVPSRNLFNEYMFVATQYMILHFTLRRFALLK